MYKILIADDERKIRETLFDYLSAKGIHVTLARNGEEAVELVTDEWYDMIILDVMMPVMDGIQACREIRKDRDMPILFLSALGEEQDLLKGYHVGADDYIVKPFPLSVLYQKCMTVIARYKGVDKENKLTIDGITLDFAGRKLYIDNREASMQEKDFQILSYLMQNKNIVLSRELILTKVWGYDFEGDNRVVDTHIKRIRKILGKKSCYIQTKINVGYCFIGEQEK